MIRSFLFAACALGLAGTAAADTMFTAKLQTPVAEAEEVVAARAVWVCQNDVCLGELNRKTATVRTCKKVAEEVGKLAEFKSENGALSSEDLAKCNESAKS